MATFLLEARNIPSYMWDEAVKYVLYLHKRVPCKSVVGVSLYEALMGHKPNISHLRVFGSKAWDKIPTEKRKSFQPQTSKCILLGYAYDAKA